MKRIVVDDKDEKRWMEKRDQDSLVVDVESSGRQFGQKEKRGMGRRLGR